MSIKEPSINSLLPQDPDLVEQAQPGHGVPSQDPSVSAQVGLTASEASRETSFSLVGGGAMAGVAVGAAVGATVAGPVGIVVGGRLVVWQVPWAQQQLPQLQSQISLKRKICRLTNDRIQALLSAQRTWGCACKCR